jgi:hypothetical protein
LIRVRRSTPARVWPDSTSGLPSVSTSSPPWGLRGWSAKGHCLSGIGRREKHLEGCSPTV